MMHWRVHMVHQWCTYGAEPLCTYRKPGVYIWCSRCVHTSMVHRRMHIAHQGGHISYNGGIHMVHKWCAYIQQVCNLVHQWCTSRCGRVVQMVHLWRRPSPPRPHPLTGVPLPRANVGWQGATGGRRGRDQTNTLLWAATV
jgi:hypothetical protein